MSNSNKKMGGIGPQHVTGNPLSAPTGNIHWIDVEDTDDSEVKVDPKLLLEEILKSKDTDLQEDLGLVIRYLRGCLEEVMDNPWFLDEIKDLRKRLEESERRCEILEKRVNRLAKNEMLRL